MNILPKKRWHVRNRENIAKVRKDEAAAASEEREKERRRRLAEQEAKIEALRSRSKQKNGSSSQLEKRKQYEFGTPHHINLFEGVETSTKNKDHEQEIKEENEKYEKQIGYLTYLGQNTNEANGQVSWYNRPRSELNRLDDKIIEKCEKSKLMLDPLGTIDVILSKTSRISKSEKSIDQKLFENKSYSNEGKTKTIDELKIVGKRCTSTPATFQQKMKGDKQEQLDKLREKRLKREKMEKMRIEKLITQRQGVEKSVINNEVALTCTFSQKYNSQFNPHLARQNHLK